MSDFKAKMHQVRFWPGHSGYDFVSGFWWLCPWSLDHPGGIGADLMGPEEHYLTSIASWYRGRTTV